MHNEIEEQVRQLRAGVAARNADVVEDAIGQLEFFIWDDVWPNELFDAMKGLLLDADFLAIPTSLGMVHLIQGNWDELSPAQRAELRPSLPAHSTNSGTGWAPSPWLRSLATATPTKRPL